MRETKLLLINDITGYGKVALSAMIPVLSYMGYGVYNLPTAVVSNTFEYARVRIADMTEYLEGALGVWRALGFAFDAVSTGFIAGERQMRVVADFCREQSAKGVKIFNDPIMGDNGRLYDGVPESTVDYMRELLAVSDVTMPNYTEACFLVGREPHACASREEVRTLIDALRNLGAKSVIITSVASANGRFTAGYDAASGEYFHLPYEQIDVHFPGTGDIFSSVVIAGLMRGRSLEKTTQSAMDVVKRLVVMNAKQEDKNKGIPIERCLSVFDKI